MTTTKAKTRTPGRTPAPEQRAPAQEDRVPQSGRGPIVNRSGQPVQLRVFGDIDQFYIDPHIVPEGWTYEWKRHSTFNQVDTQHQTRLQLNGWEPVPAERHDGLFMEKGYKGAIIRDGMMLMERDDRLTAEAKRIEEETARSQLRSSRQIAGLMPASRITDMDHDGARRNTGVKVDRLPTLPVKNYTYTVDE